MIVAVSESSTFISRSVSYFFFYPQHIEQCQEHRRQSVTLQTKERAIEPGGKIGITLERSLPLIFLGIWVVRYLILECCCFIWVGRQEIEQDAMDHTRCITPPARQKLETAGCYELLGPS